MAEYAVLGNESFVAQSTGDTLTNSTSVALRSVLNLGIGFQVYVSQAVSLYGSVILDRNAAGSRTRFDLSSPDMTIYHVTGG